MGMHGKRTRKIKRKGLITPKKYYFQLTAHAAHPSAFVTPEPVP